MTAPHRCDGCCTCPHHGTPLVYWPAGGDHACQDPACEFAHGMNDLLTARIDALRASRAVLAELAGNPEPPAALT